MSNTRPSMQSQDNLHSNSQNMPSSPHSTDEKRKLSTNTLSEVTGKKSGEPGFKSSSISCQGSTSLRSPAAQPGKRGEWLHASSQRVKQGRLPGREDSRVEFSCSIRIWAKIKRKYLFRGQRYGTVWYLLGTASDSVLLEQK